VVGFRVLGMDHVNITAPEELHREVCDFYRETLGLGEMEKPPGASPTSAWFEAGEGEVHVSVDPHNPPLRAHFGVVVDDFDAVVTDLRAAGMHIEQASAIPGRRRFYTRDPAGNRVEILAYDEGA
jgi:catechol 2,3-dioxygenase-like lactoylglutathione lyase family enzyme